MPSARRTNCPAPARPQLRVFLAVTAALWLAAACAENTGQRARRDAAPDGAELGDGSGLNDGDSFRPSDLDNVGELVTFDPGFATLTITVPEPVQVARAAAPVSGGIPFARGVLQPEQVARLTLADTTGHRVKSFQQPVVLGTWSDGSVKWLLLDFLTAVAAEAEASFTLGLADVDGGDGPAVQVTEEAEHFVVDTGLLKAVLSKQQFSLFDAVWIDANGDGTYQDAEKAVVSPGEMFIDLDDDPPGPTDQGVYDYPDQDFFGMEGGNWLRSSQSATSTRYLASRGDFTLELYRQGRSHVVFKLSGWHENAAGRAFGKYSLYVHFWAAMSSVRVSHTWIMTGDPEKNFIRRMGLELPVGGSAATLDYTFGGRAETAGQPVTFNPSEEPFVPVERGPSQLHTGQVSRTGQVALVALGPDKYYHNVPLSQDLAVDYELLQDGEQLASGEAPSGWGAVTSDGIGVAAGVRDFWREHPKEVQFSAGKLAVYL